jgi:uncharacterized protein YndB with AHSA1/START domain
MARNAIHVDAPPEAVWEVLGDPRLYGNWVVGASTTFKVDGRWPEVGAVLHHAQMMIIRDTTVVLESEPPRRLLLEARARPLMVAMVEVTLEPDGDGTLLVLRHHGLDEAVRQPHDEGWGHYLARLRRAAAGDPPGRDPWIVND